MIFEWLGREGIIILEWLLFSTLAGVAALPLCLRLFSALPDRGYTLARATGILLVAFVYWLLGSYGLLVCGARRVDCCLCAGRCWLCGARVLATESLDRDCV
jgi:uncharacterized membrane protein